MTDPSRLFAWLMILGGASIIAASTYTTFQMRSIADRATEINEVPPAPPPAPVEKPAPLEPVDEMRPVDLAVISYLERPMPAPLIEDVSRGKPFRIDLVSESGRVYRALVDLDRDGKFDERWRLFDPEAKQFIVEREVSPDDDERYSEAFRWDGRRWAPL